MIVERIDDDVNMIYENSNSIHKDIWVESAYKNNDIMNRQHIYFEHIIKQNVLSDIINYEQNIQSGLYRNNTEYIRNDGQYIPENIDSIERLVRRHHREESIIKYQNFINKLLLQQEEEDDLTREYDRSIHLMRGNDYKNRLNIEQKKIDRIMIDNKNNERLLRPHQEIYKNNINYDYIKKVFNKYEESVCYNEKNDCSNMISYTRNDTYSKYGVGCSHNNEYNNNNKYKNNEYNNNEYNNNNNNQNNNNNKYNNNKYNNEYNNNKYNNKYNNNKYNNNEYNNNKYNNNEYNNNNINCGRTYLNIKPCHVQSTSFNSNERLRVSSDKSNRSHSFAPGTKCVNENIYEYNKDVYEEYKNNRYSCSVSSTYLDKSTSYSPLRIEQNEQNKGEKNAVCPGIYMYIYDNNNIYIYIRQ
eukprot:GHVL01016923.1.p1 GENE.GHVL01016923.1~~GHVL01016923.1.p1  ORF type:complete len:414 (+),score=141.91 GHVL01016923.1:1931-3172(+)